MLNFKVESIDEVPEELRHYYEEKDSVYFLKVNGLEDTSALKRAKDREVEAAKTLRTQLKEATERLTALEAAQQESVEGGARKKGDIETLEKSWSAKLAAETKKRDDSIASLQQMLTETVVGGEASRIASEISKSPKIMERFLRDRMKAEIVDGKPTLRILDAEGNISAMTTAELRQEFMDSADFAPMIVASRATGGGALGSGGSASGKRLVDMSESERVQMAKADPAGFERLLTTQSK